MERSELLELNTDNYDYVMSLLGHAPQGKCRTYGAMTLHCHSKRIPCSANIPHKVDYMAAGRPTILAIDGVIREVVESAGGGIFVPPGDDRALAEAVRRLYDNPSEAEAMRKAARSFVTEHFNRHQQAQDFIQLVRRLAQKRQA